MEKMKLNEQSYVWLFANSLDLTSFRQLVEDNEWMAHANLFARYTVLHYRRRGSRAKKWLSMEIISGISVEKKINISRYYGFG